MAFYLNAVSNRIGSIYYFFKATELFDKTNDFTKLIDFS